MAGAKRNSFRKRLFRFSITLLARTTCPNNSSTAWRTTPYREAGPTTPARVATAPAAGSVGSARRGLLRPAWPEPRTPLPTPGDPRRVVSRRPARRPVDSPTDSGPVECGGGSAARAAAVPPRPSQTGHSGRRSRGRAPRSTSCWSQRTNRATSSARVTACALGLASIAELPYQRRILAALPVLGAAWRFSRRLRVAMAS